MSMLVAALVFVVLLAATLAHLLWAFGSRWPIRDPELLARTVIGRPGVTRVPRLMALLVAIGTLAAGILALALADHTAGGWTLSLAGAAVGALFLTRGALAFTPAWRERHPVEPFATLDRRNYGPLCIGIGAGFVILVIMRLL